MWNWLKGKKTYILTALGAVASILGYTATGGISALIPMVLNFVTSPEMMDALTFGGIAAVRHSIGD